MMARCWTARYEALGYESAGDAMMDHSADQVEALCIEAGYSLDEDPEGGYWNRLRVFDDICMELDGHAGPHSFVKDSDLVLTFA